MTGHKTLIKIAIYEKFIIFYSSTIHKTFNKIDI